MSQRITLDPVTRIEGHLAFRVDVENDKVVDAFCSGEMFRGFETILQGRHPMDAQQITQRICGVCPISHGVASVLAQEDAYHLAPPANGRILRNLIQGSNFLQSHITHFYLLSALDFIDIAAISSYSGNDAELCQLKAWVQHQLSSRSVYPAAPFLPRFEATYCTDPDLNITGVKHYLDSLKIRKLCHQMVALWGGKAPHATAIVPGGITERVSVQKIVAFQSMLREVRTFIENAYLSDVVSVAQAFPEYWRAGKGYGSFLAFGAFPESDTRKETLFPSGVIIDHTLSELQPDQITEDVLYSHYASASGRHPTQSQTLPDPDKHNAYSWIKAPRYNQKSMEVGPLARIQVACARGNHTIQGLVDATCARLNLPASSLVSVMGRHLARALETRLIADRLTEWVAQLVPGNPTVADVVFPLEGAGVGLTEAPRGALGHWISMDQGKIKQYQCVVPTTWNCSPRDDRGNRGPIEQALIGTAVSDRNNPIEVARVIRSFDPCIACAVH